MAHGDGTRAVDLLAALGLPRDKRRGFAETYGQPSLIPTPSEERARYLDATAGEIERTLETVEGVVSARVHLVLEETDPLAVDAKPKSAARAAVLLKARPGRRPDRGGGRPEAGGGERGRTRRDSPSAWWSPLPPLPPKRPPRRSRRSARLRLSPGTRPLLIGAVVAVLLVLALLATLLLVTARRLAALERAAGDHAARLPGPAAPQS